MKKSTHKKITALQFLTENAINERYEKSFELSIKLFEKVDKKSMKSDYIPKKKKN